jgi:WD40 repeat protein
VLAVSVIGLPMPVKAQSATAYQVGQTIEVREGDAWSAATILKHEGRRYLIHYAGSDSSNDEWVGTDRMRATGSTGTPAVPSGDKTPVPPTSSSPPAQPDKSSWTNNSDDQAPRRHPRLRTGGGDMFPMPDEVIGQTEPDRAKIDAYQTADAPPAWSVVPDTTTRPAPLQSYALWIKSGDREMDVQQALPCLNGGAVVGFVNFGEKARRVERVGTKAGPLRASLPAQCLPMAASPSGALLVCRCNKFGFGNNSRIDAFTLAHGAATPLVSFTPYPSEDGNGKPEDIRFATALDEKRIITCDLKGRIIAWDIAANSVEGEWRVDVGQMHFDGDCRNVAISPTGKWLAAASKTGITFVDCDTGNILGAIANSSDQPIFDLACSPSGKTLIARHGDGAAVSYDIASGKELRTVELPENAGPLTCVDDGFILANAQRLIAANTGAVIAEYRPMADARIAVTGPGITFLASSTRVVAVHIPSEHIRAKVLASADSGLALHPGMSVAVDIQLDMSDTDKAAVDAAIRKKLTDDEFVIAASADTVVICRTELGEQHEHVYAKSPFGMPVLAGGNGTSMILTDKVTRITIQQKGQTIWERTRVCGPANSFRLKDGQSLEDGARETITYDPGFLENIVIPPYVAMPQTDAVKK